MKDPFSSRIIIFFWTLYSICYCIDIDRELEIIKKLYLLPIKEHGIDCIELYIPCRNGELKPHGSDCRSFFTCGHPVNETNRLGMDWLQGSCPDDQIFEHFANGTGICKQSRGSLCNLPKKEYCSESKKFLFNKKKNTLNLSSPGDVYRKFKVDETLSKDKIAFVVASCLVILVIIIVIVIALFLKNRINKEKKRKDQRKLRSEINFTRKTPLKRDQNNFIHPLRF